MSQENSILNYFSKTGSKQNSQISSQKSPKSKREAEENSSNGSPLKKQSQKQKKEESEVVDNNSQNKSNNSTNGTQMVSEEASTSFPYVTYDIIWSRLEGFPYWPSIVCPHPLTFDIKKCENNIDKVHVQFFDDPPQRSWIKLSDTIIYKGPTHPVHKIIVKKDLKKAIEYAEEAFKMPKDNRRSLIVELKLSDEEDSVESKHDAKGDHKSPPKVSPVITNMSKRKASLRGSQKKRKRVIVMSSDDDSDENKDTEIGGGDCKRENIPLSIDSSSDEVMEVDESSPEKPKNPTKESKQSSRKHTSATNSFSKYFTQELTTEELNTKADASWPHLQFEFLKAEKIRDANKRRPSEPDYDPKTLYVPHDFLRKQTPAHKQWWEMKSQHFDTVLFFKVGKFYELFHMDAVIGYNELNLTHMNGDIAHAGFPEISYQSFSDRLITKGFKVARVEQTETSEQRDERCKSSRNKSKDDKVVAREICRITTPATRTCSVLDAEPPDLPKYLVALCEKVVTEDNVHFGVCFADTSTSSIWMGCFIDNKHLSALRTLFATHPPAEIIMEHNNVSTETKVCIEKCLPTSRIECLSSEKFSAEFAINYITEKNIFMDNGVLSLPHMFSEIFLIRDDGSLSYKPDFEMAVQAFSAIINVLSTCQIDDEIITMKQFQQYVPANCESSENKKLVLDSISLKNLEVFVNSNNESKGTLMETMNFCYTKFGVRMLYQWLCYPLCDIKLINARLDAVEDLMNFQKQCVEFSEVGDILKQMPDLQRSLMQIHSQGSVTRSTTHPDSRAVMFEEDKYSKRKIIDFIKTKTAFRKAHKIVSLFDSFRTKMKSPLLSECTSFEFDGGHFPNMKEVLDFFDKAFDHEEAKARGQIIPNSGVDEAYDNATKQIKRVEAKSESYLKSQSEFFNCKVNYFGTGRSRFQLEVPEGKAKKATSTYEYSSSKKGYRRFITPETKDLLIELTAAEEAQQNASKDILRKLFAKFDESFEQWIKIVKCLGLVDCLMSLVKCSESMKQYGSVLCRPEFVVSNEPLLRIKNGKHPCLLRYCDNFVENDIELKTKLMLVTGPNMGGKSTLMRQTALIAIMAQIGTFVPADECVLTPVDRVFTRLGASDRILEGESTFYVELSETSIILKDATDRSL
ncbi:DNA mismatch repair protein Msh6-like protein, partial [Leptotrombidium deliense]